MVTDMKNLRTLSKTELDAYTDEAKNKLVAMMKTKEGGELVTKVISAVADYVLDAKKDTSDFAADLLSASVAFSTVCVTKAMPDEASGEFNQLFADEFARVLSDAVRARGHKDARGSGQKTGQ